MEDRRSKMEDGARGDARPPDVTEEMLQAWEGEVEWHKPQYATMHISVWLLDTLLKEIRRLRAGVRDQRSEVNENKGEKI